MSIVLQRTEQTLNEVTVTATPPTFKMSHGMFQANIQGTAYSQLGKAVGLCQKSDFGTAYHKLGSYQVSI